MLGGILGIIAALVVLWGAVFLPSFLTAPPAVEHAPLATSTERTVSHTEQSPLPQPFVAIPPVKKISPSPTSAPRKAESKNDTLTPREEATPTVVAPGPLRVVQEMTGTSHTLSADGVFVFTNKARADAASLSSLVRSETLDRAAQIKLDDMFGRQYFEHISPIGVGPADLAKTVGYAYVVVGENLALGNFENDEKLVDAWMNSPGHRANILNTHYREIGIAVGKGIYEGKETWLAVQSFGTPLSACPVIDTQIKAQIESNNTEIARQKNVIDMKKAEIDGTSPYDPAYNMLISEYNALISPYNALVEQTRALVSFYNMSVQKFNECIAEAGGSG